MLRFWRKDRTIPTSLNERHQDEVVLTVSEHCYYKIFSCLQGRDLKNCRLVCSIWKWHVDLLFDEMTHVIFDGRKPVWKDYRRNRFRFSSTFNRFLKKSENQLLLWRTLKMRQILTFQIWGLVTTYSSDFRDAVSHIQTLELESCRLTWKCLVQILNHFESLETLKLIRNIYYYRNLFLEDMYYKLGGFIPTKFSEGAVPSYNENCCKNLKHVQIQESRNEYLTETITIPRRGTVEILKTLNKTGTRAQELDFKAEIQDLLASIAEQILLWIKLAIFICHSEIKVLRIEVTRHSNHRSFEHFSVFTLNLLSIMPNRNILTNLYLHFPLIQPEDSVDRYFCPFIESLTNLKLLSLKMIIVKRWNTSIIERMKPRQNNCQYEIGVLIHDRDGLGMALEVMTLMKSQFYIDHVTVFHITFFEDELPDLASLLLTTTEEEPRTELIPYVNVEELVVRSYPEETIESSFQSYNLDIIILMFPNLTKLKLRCGPNGEDRFKLYLQQGMKNTANINDYDVRLIIQHLLKLKFLSLWANLEEVTDFGITGIVHGHLGQIKIGHSFSHLLFLEKLSLRGVGPGITDMSAYHGFSNIPRLQYLEVIGNHKMGKSAKEFLRKEVRNENAWFSI